MKKYYLLRFSWLWLTLFMSIGLAWHLLAYFDFGYAIWYEFGGIKETIQLYAPQNNFKQGFENVAPALQIEAFHHIVQAIQNDGTGLASISYPLNGQLVPLLHQEEIIHLQDVANLISYLNNVFYTVIFLWLLITGFLIIAKINLTSFRYCSFVFLAGITLISAFILTLGATKIFYQFHVWIFPAENKWFFYYQDSLMSTMMKAPDIFGYIGASLALTAIIIFIILISLITKIYFIFAKKA